MKKIFKHLVTAALILILSVTGYAVSTQTNRCMHGNPQNANCSQTECVNPDGVCLYQAENTGCQPKKQCRRNAAGNTQCPNFEAQKNCPRSSGHCARQ